MITYVLTALIVLICMYAGYSYIKKLRKGGDCCGEREAAEKKVKVADRDARHYPYTATLSIEGMMCTNCARKVENAFNRQDGVWRKVDFAGRKAVVRMKQPMDDAKLRRIVREAGYTVLKIADKQGY